MSRLQHTFDGLRQRGEAALIPFITAGDPTPQLTLELIHVLAAAGADIIELGVPFSDPMADGPTIQAASERALAAGTTLAKVLDIVAQARRDLQIPLVLMGYYNPVFRYGAERFARDAVAAGVDGLLLVDLPPEEMAEIKPATTAAGLPLITLLAPTTPLERMSRLAAAAEGYIYYVSMTGVTGTQAVTPAAIRDAVVQLKTMTQVPVAVGFGITTATAVQEVAEFADAVVVGSALVNIIGEHGRDDDMLDKVAAFTKSLKQGCKKQTQIKQVVTPGG